MSSSQILRVENYRQHFHISRDYTVKAVDGITFSVKRGEIFGLVGESGSGKSTVARAIMGIYKPTSGSVHFKQHCVSEPRSYAKGRSDIQRNMQFIFQDSAAALNPRMRAGDIIAEPLRLNRLYPDKRSLQIRINELMELVGLGLVYKNKLPSEISGGQRQRVAIARSIGPNPELIVADEPIAALDVSIQAQIVTLFQRLQRENGFTFVFIAHDLSMVRYLCDRVGVMYMGKLVEMAGAEELFSTPLHLYTQSLLSAIPIPDPRIERGKAVISFQDTVIGCEFHEATPGHFVRI